MWDHNQSRLRKQIRAAIESCGVTGYALSKESGISEAMLAKFHLAGPDSRSNTSAYAGLESVKRRDRRQVDRQGAKKRAAINKGRGSAEMGNPGFLTNRWEEANETISSTRCTWWPTPFSSFLPLPKSSTTSEVGGAECSQGTDPPRRSRRPVAISVEIQAATVGPSSRLRLAGDRRGGGETLMRRLFGHQTGRRRSF